MAARAMGRRYSLRAIGAAVAVALGGGGLSLVAQNSASGGFFGMEKGGSGNVAALKQRMEVAEWRVPHRAQQEVRFLLLHQLNSPFPAFSATTITTIRTDNSINSSSPASTKKSSDHFNPLVVKKSTPLHWPRVALPGGREIRYLLGPIQ